MKKYILILLLVILGVAIVVGFTGIKKKVVIKENDCQADYAYYHLEPFLFNIFSCLLMRPCGIDQELDKINAKIEVIQCLCKNISINEDIIVKNFNELKIYQPSTDVNYICTKGATIIPRK